MKIERIEPLIADAGWRTFSFLKMTTSDGITGWSEYNEDFGSKGLSAVISALAPLIIGMDPRASEAVLQRLHVATRQARGSLNQQAIAAIENALLDIRGKEAGKSIAALFGGPLRTRIPVYWSHFATYRIAHRGKGFLPELNTYDDLAKHAAEVKAMGFRCLKTNIFRWQGGKLTPYVPGFGRTVGWPELNWDEGLLADLARQLGCIREAIGPEMGLMLDTNFNFKTEGYKRVADTIAPFNMRWMEVDTHDPPSLAQIRRDAACPIASCETLHGRREFLPYLQNYAMDVGIVDVPWNGLGESLKIAHMAETFEINVAPHNFYGHLCSYTSAHFSAAVPNFRIMEIDIDSTPWRDEFVTRPPVIENGEFVLPDTPGWGADVNEKAVRARPPRT
ncbi:mandelate racemase/muconate lactonizing enzyme family protein [Desertibaculum subflavum]|uniref:mandelate racemase/muconate lactonizing enzyme family protein n=1 Tax=Desertibaculum subflavum TaxID=2268458 RepID=UPI000E66E7A1